jgi:hypothetical protein
MPSEKQAEAAFEKLYGKELAEQLRQLKGKNGIGTVEAERRERARQKQVDEEKLRQAEEDEKRRFPDK